MGEKSEQKRDYILKKAQEIFAAKGFCAVTMKDIVEACEISRGGLYLYFGSTREIFQAILVSRREEEQEELTEHIPEDSTMADLLMVFLKEQKKIILRRKNDFTIATYEFLFAHRPEKKSDHVIRSRFEKDMMVLTQIIEEGTMNGEFYCVSPQAEAANIMYVLEGMKICARTIGLSESKVDQELLYIMEGLIVEEE